jgi:hypothetical protein
MKQKTLALGLGLLGLLGGAVALFQMPHHQKVETPDLQDMLGSPKTALQLHLYGAARNAADGSTMSGKILGYDYYSNGGRTHFHDHNLLEKGGSEDIFYRPDGSKSEVKEFFPLSDPESQAVLNSDASFAADGSYTSHIVLKMDGKIERIGQLQAGGQYTQTYYCDDGKHKHRERLFDKDSSHSFLSESLYDCSSGMKYAEVLPGGFYGTSSFKLFRADGSLSAELTKDYTGLTGNLYGSDGKTVIAKLTSGWGSQQADYLNADGKVYMSSSSSFGRTKVTSTDPATGRKVSEQEWKERPGENGAPSRLLLVKVTEYAQDSDNKESRVIEMSDDGTVPKSVSISVPAGFDFSKVALPPGQKDRPEYEKLREQTRLIQTIKPDGTVVKTELSILYQSWNDVTLPPENLPTTVHIDKGLFTAPVHVDVPSFDDAGPDKVYDYP